MKLIVLLSCVTASLLWQAESFPSGDPPMFTATLEDQVVPEMEANGDDASFSLQCQVTGSPTPTITWFRGGIEIEGETAATLTVDPIVTGTDATTAGVEYYCEANNSFGRIRSRRALVQLATFGTWNVSETRTIDARSGFSVAIPCNPPPANPAPRVVWQKNGVDIPAADPLNGGSGERVQVLPSGHLVIHALEASDYGGALYRCSVRNVETHSISDSPQMFTLMNVSGSMLPPTAGQTFLHVFNHEPTGQAERGKTFYVFNVVQPTEEDNIFSNGVPNVALRNQREVYIIDNVDVSDNVRLDVQYFASVDQNAQSRNAENLGSLFTDINVIDPARVMSVTGPHRVLTGRPVTLTCNIAAIPDATVMWYKDGNPVPSGTSISNTPDTNTQLTIASATPADSGMYQCVVSNQHGDDVGSISLQVRDHQLELMQGLDRETPFLAGNNQTLTVIVRSDTEPTVTWSVNGQQLTSSNSTYTIDSPVAGPLLDGVLREYTISLSVFFLNTTYQGEYRVVVEVPSDGLSVETTGNVLQERLTSNVIVEVVDSPCLLVGTDVTLRCQPDGVPRSRVTWLQNVMELSSNSKYRISDYPEFTLTITDVVSSDAGSYTCRAENTLTNGTASGIVTETFNMFATACMTPTIPESPNGPVNNNPMLTAGEPLTLTCTAMGTPRPEIEWYRGDSMITSSSRIQITNINSDIVDTTVVSTLIISSVTVGDAGTYECRAENMAGTASQEYSVSVDPVAFPWWAILAIALGALLIVVVVIVVCVVCCCLFRRSGTYEIGGKDETDGAEEEFNPLYASIPAQRPPQPPEYKQAPSYPSGTSLVRTPMHMSEMDNRFNSLPPPDSSSPYLPQSYSKEFYVREGRHHASHQDFSASDGQFV